MFIVEPEIGGHATVITIPHMIKDEIFIIWFSGKIKKKRIGRKETFYIVNKYPIPINRMEYFSFGGILIENDNFNEHKCLIKDQEIIDNFNKFHGKTLKVNKIIEQSWYGK